MSWANELDPGDSLYPVANLPYGVAQPVDGSRPPAVVVAIGAQVLEVAPVAGDLAEAVAAPSLDGLLALGRPAWLALRERLTAVLTDAEARPLAQPHLHPREQMSMLLPWTVADYVDFYSSEAHARNVGRLFRPDADDPLPVNWRHLPSGYHGRAGTVVVSGTDVVRPCGQRKPAGAEVPVYGPTQALDIEAEVGFVVGGATELGQPVAIADFPAHVFGVCLVNDWSARDLQAWEYVPLGPFLGKSFATSVSPWVIPLDALQAARVSPPRQDPEPLPYLRTAEPWGLDIALEVEWNGTVVSRPPYASMYWTAPQQLAHLTVNGASLRTGDLFASGTVSGPSRDQVGSFLEQSDNGARPIALADGSTRTFLEDGDTVVIRATAPGGAGRIGLGEVRGTVRPAR
ncbi:MAG TPA: fumarylacetoacetase [Mycobacteriales bacterium]|nr:fumarylacetoacetase [Mycobacteriales bacterium]